MSRNRRRKVEWLLEPIIFENEASANLSISIVLALSSFSFLLVYVLIVLGVFLGGVIEKSSLLLGAGMFAMIVGVCRVKKGSGRVLKYVQTFFLLLAVFWVNVLTGYKVMILFSLPIILSCRFYRRKFTVLIATLSGLFIIICAFTNAYLSTYLPSMDLDLVVFGETGMLSLEGSLNSAVIAQGYDSSKTLLNAIRLSVFPNCLAIVLLAFGCDRFIRNAQVMLAEKYESSENEKHVLMDLKDQNDIVSNAGLGIWYITLEEGQRPRMKPNDKMREILGIDGMDFSAEEIYSFWYDRIPGSELDGVNASVSEMLNGHFSENTYKWNHPTKGEIYVRCGGNANLLGKGISVLNGYHADVTSIVINEQHQKEVLEQAVRTSEEASKAKTVFLNNMSHDIRTPMNAILGFASLMENRLDNPELTSEYLKKIRNSGEYLLTIINNVLDLAKIESGNTHLDMSVYEFSKDGIVKDLFQDQMQKRNLRFVERLDIQHGIIFTDVPKCHQIFVNLLSNAVKYTPDGGSIVYEVKEIPCDREGFATYVSTITDTGIGMSQEYLEHVFDDFSRERNTTDSKIGGTGLGMPIVKRLVDLLGGTISIESELGKGTRITIVMSHRIENNIEAYYDQNVESLPNTPVLEGKRILLAEDNELNAEIAISLLEDVGLSIDRACDGVACVKMLSDCEPGYYDAILMDIQMPNMTGYEATRRIRSLSGPKSQIPIIAMTANAFEEDKQAALDCGMNGHVAKPIDIEVLLEELYRHLLK